MSQVGKPKSLPAGTLLGSYVVDSLLAHGGMGAVYRVRNRVTGEPRALKVIRPHLAHDPDFVQRFMREAAIASKLHHPNLVETLEPGIDGETVFLPMEMLEGTSLSERLKRGGAMAPPDVVRIMRSVCDAVQFLHDKRLLHRDLKPMNVFLAVEGGTEVPKVLDFGTAKQVEDDEHTRTGFVVGSPHYMAPEQAEGRKDLDARIDQYSLGVIAYQLLTGTRPYEGDDRESALAKILRGAPFARPHDVRGDLPPALADVVMRALARDRDQRYPDVRAFGDALTTALAATSATVVGAHPHPASGPYPVPSSGAYPVPASGPYPVPASGTFPTPAVTPEVATPMASSFAAPPASAPKSGGGRAVFAVLGVLALLVVGSGVGYALWQRSHRPPETVVAVSLAGPSGEAPVVEPPTPVAPPTAPPTGAVPAAPNVAVPAPNVAPNVAVPPFPVGYGVAASPFRDAGVAPHDAGVRRRRGDAGEPHAHHGPRAEECGPEYDRPCL